MIRPLLQLGDHVRDRFGAHLPPVGDDDVAELALERAPTRRLHTPESILVHFEELDARRRAIAHVDLIGLHVVVAMGALAPVSEELLPGVLAFTLEQDVAVRSAPLREDVADRATHADEPSAPPERIRHLEEARLLDSHRGQGDHIALDVEVDGLNILVDDLDVEFGRS